MEYNISKDIFIGVVLITIVMIMLLITSVHKDEQTDDRIEVTFLRRKKICK